MKASMYPQTKAASTRQWSGRGLAMPVVLVAMALLLAGLQAIGGLRIPVALGAEPAGAKADGALLAADRMERLMGLPYDAVWLDDSDRDGANGLADIRGNADFTESAGAYTISWNIAENELLKGSKTIRLIVVPLASAKEGRYELQFIKTS